jgi:hypothetical protein
VETNPVSIDPRSASTIARNEPGNSQPFIFLHSPEGVHANSRMDMTPELHTTQRDDLYAVFSGSEELASDLAELCEWLSGEAIPCEATEMDAPNTVLAHQA